MRKNLLVTALLAVSFGLCAQGTALQQMPAKAPVTIPAVDGIKSPVVMTSAEMVQMPVKQVLSTTLLEDGSQCRLVRLENGQIKKQFIKAGASVIDQNTVPVPAAITKADGEFFEGFEGWDGAASAWLPDGWSQESKKDSDESSTWRASDGPMFGPMAAEGNYMARIQFMPPSFDEETATSTTYLQDDWMYTSKVLVNKGDIISFSWQVDHCFARLNYETMEFDMLRTYLEFYVSADGGKTWVKEWSSEETTMAFTEEELWSLVMSFPWYTASIDADKYAGKEITMAFRYVNDNGESMHLDAVRVGEYVPDPQAYYVKPQGMFYWGLTEDFGAFPDNVMFGPAYTPITWNSYINSETESVEWSFYDFGAGDFVAVEGDHPTKRSIYSFGPSPRLDAINGDVVNSFHWGENAAEDYTGYVKFGGPSTYNFLNDGLIQLTVGNYDLNNKGMAYAGANLFSKETLESEGSVNKYVGIGNYFEKPLSPYMFETFYVHLYDIDVADDAELTMTLIRVGEDGALADTINSSTIYGRDIVRPIDGRNYATLMFTFKDIDPETGREQDTHLEIADAMLAVLSGHTDGMINPLLQAENHEFNTGYAYVIWDVEGETRMSTVSSMIGLYTSFMFGMDVTIPFIYTENSRYEADPAGERHVFEISDYYFLLQNSEGEYQWFIEGEVPEWITIGTMTEDKDGVVSVPVTFKRLPGNVEGRAADITLATIGGARLKLEVKQGNASWAGISQINESKVKAYVANNNIYVAYPEGTTALTVYSANGRIAGQYRLNESGAAVISAAHLNNGVYILRFDGKTTETLKIIK